MTNKQQQKEQHAWSKNYHHVTVFGKSSYHADELENLQIPDAREKIKIDRSHRVGRKRDSNRKPRAIVVKFNYFQDREHIRINARKLRSTRIGIAEQFPKEIEKIRQTLYPETKKAKAQEHRVRMVRDRLYINNVEFKLFS